jgi:porphobilinogen synthase
MEIRTRLRRLRQSEAIRGLVEESTLSPRHFVAPFFVMDGKGKKEAIPSMPGQFRYSIDQLIKEFESYMALDITALNLFCYVPPEKKDARGSEAWRRGNLLERATKAIKKEFPQALLMVDIALDPFTSHGHDGIVRNNKIVNDATVELLTRMALLAAEAGADVVAPSDMMDGRIGAIRAALDREGFIETAILSYAAKYASAFYGPFRSALDSAPSFGDKKTYQMNPANCREALRECALDEEEGADMLLIKPAITNLDIIAKVRAASLLPLGAYQVSGEYSMIKYGAEKGFLDEERAFYETLLAIHRAGADFIFTYAAKQVAKMLKR